MLAPKTNSEPSNLNFSLQKSEQTARFEFNIYLFNNNIYLFIYLFIQQGNLLLSKLYLSMPIRI